MKFESKIANNQSNENKFSIEEIEPGITRTPEGTYGR